MKVDSGVVRVVGGPQQTIDYVISNHSYAASEEKARREFESYKISVSVRGDTAWVLGEWQGSRPRRSSSEFVINIPRNTDLVKVETEGGDLTATGVSGRVEGETGGGSIRLDDIGGAVNAETGGGSIDVGTVGGELALHTGGGSIKVGSAKGKINAETGGGSVVVVACAQGAVLETGGGSIEVQHCSGPLKVTTGGGSIELGEIAGAAEIETGGGSIRLSSATGAVRAADRRGQHYAQRSDCGQGRNRGRRHRGQICFRRRPHGLGAGNFRRGHYGVSGAYAEHYHSGVHRPGERTSHTLRFFRDSSYNRRRRVGSGHCDRRRQL